MVLPSDVQAVIRRFAERFPIPQGQPGPAHEDRVREWTLSAIGQVVHELPGQGWGSKRASDGRPLSKDAIARWQDGRMVVWDLLIGSGTGTPRLAVDPHGEDVTGQVFVPVQAQNRLGVGPGPGEVITHPEPTDTRAVLDRLDRLEAAVRALADTVAILVNNVGERAKQLPPEYVGETVIPFPAWAGGNRSVVVVLKPRL